MVGSGAAGGGGGDDARSKEAAGMMALHEALRNVCLDSDWTYSVFWTIRPRPYVTRVPPCLSLVIPSSLAISASPWCTCRRCRGGNGCMVGDDNGSL